MSKGKCPNCGGQLSPERGATHVTCPGCGKRYRVRAAKAARSDESDTPLVAHIIGKSPGPPGSPPLAIVVPDSAPVSQHRVRRPVPTVKPPSPPPVPPRAGTSQAPFQWYIAMDKRPSGPYTIQQMREQIRSGGLRADTLVWREGMETWDEAESIPGVRSLFAQVAPPKDAMVADLGREPLIEDFPDVPEPSSDFVAIGWCLYGFCLLIEAVGIATALAGSGGWRAVWAFLFVKTMIFGLPSSIITYLDATRIGVSHLRQSGLKLTAQERTSAAVWFFVCLFGWESWFAIYLANRRRLVKAGWIARNYGI